MKKIISLLTIFVVTANIALFAEGTENKTAAASDPQTVAPAVSVVADTAVSQKPLQSTGIAAAQSSERGRTASWQNWVFAGTALVLATIGVLAVSTDRGHPYSSNPSHQ